MKVADYNNIRCVAVLTAFNPDSIAKTLKALKDGKYIVVSAQVKSGSNTRNAYAIINISLDTLKLYCGKYQHTSFVYTELNVGLIKSCYYRKQYADKTYSKAHNPFVQIESVDTLTAVNDAGDYLTVIGCKFEYQIPSSLLIECHKRINQNYLDAQRKRIFWPQPLDYCIVFSIERVGLAALRMRNMLYGNHTNYLNFDKVFDLKIIPDHVLDEGYVGYAPYMLAIPEDSPIWRQRNDEYYKTYCGNAEVVRKVLEERLPFRAEYQFLTTGNGNNVYVQLLIPSFPGNKDCIDEVMKRLGFQRAQNTDKASVILYDNKGRAWNHLSYTANDDLNR